MKGESDWKGHQTKQTRGNCEAGLSSTVDRYAGLEEQDRERVDAITG